MAVPAFADSADGTRKATARETEFFDQVFSALKDALPVPPPNWTAAPAGSRTLTSMGAGTKEGDFPIGVEARNTYRMPKEQAGRTHAEIRQLQGQIDALERLAAAVARQRQGWLDKYSEAPRARVADLSYAPVDAVVRIMANDAHAEALAPKRESEIAVGTVPAPRVPGLKVHGVRVVVEGPGLRRDGLANATDRAKLERLLR